LIELREKLRAFARERDWGRFHSPKNLAMALAAESGELLQHFQWLTEEQSRALDNKKRLAVAEEIADVLIYLVRLADELDIDLLEAASEKIVRNGEKYPVALSRGRADKYTDLAREGD